MHTIECDAILFDLDGVLIDSSACIERHWRMWADRHGVDIAAVMREAQGRKTDETIQVVAPHLDAKEEARQLEEGETIDTSGVFIAEGAIALVNSLPEDGWAIATSGTRPVATARIKHSGLPIPEVLVAAEDVTRGKPDPEPYLLAASRLGIPAGRCVVVEDAPAGIESAWAAGMQSVAIAPFPAPQALAKATIVAGRLSDIRVEQGSNSRLVIRVG